MQPVTIQDVAQRAGVSVASVSRVLSKSRPVSPAVLKAVERAALELGYTGNSIARALRLQRTDTIGMIVPSILNPFFTSLVDSLERVLHAQGKHLLLCDSRQDPEVEASHLRQLIERHVDGIVVSPCDVTVSSTAVKAAAAQIPLVQLDRRVDGGPLDWIGLDDDDAMGQIIEHVAQLGVRNAAFVGSELTNSSNQDRLQGFRNHCSKWNIECRPEWTILGEYSIQNGVTAGRALLSGDQVPDAIVCADDLIAFGVLEACRERGVSVPDAVIVTGFDDLEFASFATPGLTSIQQPTDLMAEEALRLLSRQGRQDTPQQGVRIALPARLIVRRSSRPSAEAVS